MSQYDRQNGSDFSLIFLSHFISVRKVYSCDNLLYARSCPSMETSSSLPFSFSWEKCKTFLCIFVCFFDVISILYVYVWPCKTASLLAPFSEKYDGNASINTVSYPVKDHHLICKSSSAARIWWPRIDVSIRKLMVQYLLLVPAGKGQCCFLSKTFPLQIIPKGVSCIHGSHQIIGYLIAGYKWRGWK